jgi:hypothetical protein
MSAPSARRQRTGRPSRSPRGTRRLYDVLDGRWRHLARSGSESLVGLFDPADFGQRGSPVALITQQALADAVGSARGRRPHAHASGLRPDRDDEMGLVRSTRRLSEVAAMGRL